MSVVDQLKLGWGARLPMLLQTEAAECGLASLAMCAGYHGYHVRLADLRRRFGLSLKGATLQDLTRVAHQLGLTARPVRLELEELHLLKTPCILHWDMNHFVVLKSASRSRIVIHDPSVGVRRLGLSEVFKHFTGVALELTPKGGFESVQPAPQLRLRALLGRLVGIQRSLFQLLCLARLRLRPTRHEVVCGGPG
jgi:ATP-binding cassette subfamily B protein RaxB